jgi:phage shock protein E
MDLGKVVGAVTGVKTVTYKEYLDTLQGEQTQVLDVRSPAEFATGHLKEAANLPMDMISIKMGELPKEKLIATICAHGVRSVTAAKLLASNGFKVVSIAGGNAAVPNNDKVR